MPMGDFYYTDMTAIIHQATQSLGPGELLSQEHFTLTDSMSAIEIMDPRLDNGMISYGNPPPSFDCYAPLLPEEVCWLLDRAIAAEMTWHMGCALSQTVFTLLHVHNLENLEPSRWCRYQQIPSDPQRPDFLVTDVLRAGVLGLVKSCDLAWREFSKRHMYESEDIIMEKSEISLCEGIAVARVTDTLEQAQITLESQNDLPWRDALLLRLDLRKLIIRIFAHPPHASSGQWPLFISAAQDVLQLIKASQRPPTPRSGSPANAGFDPAVSRHLVTSVPLPVIPLMEQEEAWDALQAMFHGLADVARLEQTESLLLWKTTLSVLTSETTSFRRSAFVRSRTSSAFTNGGTVVFGSHAVRWLVQEILENIGHIPKESIETCYRLEEPISLIYLNAFEAQGSDLLHSYFTSLSHNRSRQRRSNSKVLRHWHRLYESAMDLEPHLHQTTAQITLTQRLPLVILHLRLNLVVDVVLSGFEIDLYTADEKPFQYWYAAHILMAQHETLSSLSVLINEDADINGSTAQQYISTELILTSALRNLCLAVFMRLARDPLCVGPLSSSQRKVVKRRLKWAFSGPEEINKYEDIACPDIANFDCEFAASKEMNHDVSYQHERSLYIETTETLAGLRSLSPDATFSQLCPTEFQKFLSSLIMAGDAGLKTLGIDVSSHPLSAVEIPLHPWFRDL